MRHWTFFAILFALTPFAASAEPPPPAQAAAPSAARAPAPASALASEGFTLLDEEKGVRVHRREKRIQRRSMANRRRVSATNASVLSPLERNAPSRSEKKYVSQLPLNIMMKAVIANTGIAAWVRTMRKMHSEVDTNTPATSPNTCWWRPPTSRRWRPRSPRSPSSSNR